MSIFSNGKNAGSLTNMIDHLKEYISQRTDLFRLSLAEKLTAIIGQMLLCVCAAIFCAVATVLMALAFVHILAIWLPMYASYLIVAVLLAIATYILFKFKYNLIYDPLARIISSRIVKQPDDDEDQAAK